MADFVCETVNPEDPTGKSKVKVTFPKSYFSQLGPVDFENLRAAKLVLDDPKRIFRVLREYSQGGWCYTGRPAAWCIKEGVTAPFKEDEVFAVYLSPTMRVYDCRAELVAPDDPFSPVNWKTRYRGMVWKSTS